MIPHHNDALEMAAMALAPGAGANPEIRARAAQSQGAQDPGIVQMSSLLEAWGHPIEMPGMEDGASMEGMGDSMASEDMAALVTLNGTEFDAGQQDEIDQMRAMIGG